MFTRALRSTTSAALRVKNSNAVVKNCASVKNSASVVKNSNAVKNSSAAVKNSASAVRNSGATRRPAFAVAALAAAVAVPATTASAFAATGAPVAAPAAVSAPLAQGVHAAAKQAAPVQAAPAAAVQAAPAAAVHTDPYAGASFSSLEPTGTYGAQSSFTPNAAQWANAKTIVHVAESRGMPAYAAVIAVATATQESKLHNLGTAVDHDSLGLFQQRPSCGWGSPSQLTNPTYAANAFLSAMARTTPNYEHTSLWSAAQATQGSAFPTAYAQWENMAAQMTHAIATGQH